MSPVENYFTQSKHKSVCRAFTLIELLVVIAIIGILASVILTSLSGAKTQGIDAKTKSELSSLQKQANVQESASFTYATVCADDVGVTQPPEIANILASITNFASAAPVCNSDSASYAVSAPLTVNHWCVDSTGVAKEITTPLVDDDPAYLVCP